MGGTAESSPGDGGKLGVADGQHQHRQTEWTTDGAVRGR